MIKILFALVMTAICIIVGLIPEFVMYFAYSLINPTSEVDKALFMLIIFWLGGMGACVGFAALAVSIWVMTMAAIMKQP